MTARRSDRRAVSVCVTDWMLRQAIVAGWRDIGMNLPCFRRV
jgi:hypothetical protein